MRLIILMLIFLLSATIKNESKVSWYGPGFHGNTTANGETYNQNSLTAASPTLPFNTKVKVTNLKNGKSVIVRINDRGPYKMDEGGSTIFPLEPHPTRRFDLSKKAFSTIANLETGIISVRYRVIPN